MRSWSRRNAVSEESGGFSAIRLVSPRGGLLLGPGRGGEDGSLTMETRGWRWRELGEREGVALEAITGSSPVSSRGAG
jgi:hypothetical protein